VIVSSNRISARPERLRLFGAQGARLHPTDRLLFEQLSEKLHQGQHQLRDRALHVFRIRVPACRSELTDPVFELLTKRVDLARAEGACFLLAHVSSPDANA
jgi:hypothetical protein